MVVSGGVHWLRYCLQHRAVSHIINIDRLVSYVLATLR
jgi:hypothetical protein